MAFEYRIVSEQEFRTKLIEALKNCPAKSVTGPGRSGAIAAAYTSHLLDIPFVPYGRKVGPDLQPLLIVDTALYSGSTMRKAEKQYQGAHLIKRWLYAEPQMVRFWYEFPFDTASA